MHYPRIIDIELSNRCNLDCVMCGRLPQKAHLGDMARPLLDAILDEALAHPGRTFRFHGIGEPLLSEHLLYAVERVKEAPGEHGVQIVTNGHLLDRDMARALLRRGVDSVTVSVGAATAESYLRVRRSRHFDRVVANTIRLIDERDRMCAPAVVFVQLLLVPPADREVEAFIDTWAPFDVEFEIWHDFNWGRLAAGLEIPATPPPCPRLEDYTTITWDGRVAICCIDAARSYVVGDLHEVSLGAAYNGETMTEIRALHAAGRANEMGPCHGCSFRDDSFLAWAGNVFRGAARPGPLPMVPTGPIRPILPIVA